MKNNQLKTAAVLSYVQMGLGIIISLIYTPLMIKILGKSEYGLYNTVASTISMLSLLSLGFNSSYIRFYIKYKKNEDIENIAKLNGLFLIVFLIIGAVSLCCGLFLTFNLHLVFENGLTAIEYDLAKILMILLTINMTISFPMSVFANIVSAHERFVFLKILMLLKTVLTPLLTIPLLFLGYGSISIVVVTLFISLFTDILYLIYCFRNLHTRFIFKNFEKGLFRDLFVFTIFIAINAVVDQINLNVDKVLLGRFKGTEVVAVYSVGFTLYTYFQQFSTSTSSLFSPRVHRIVNTYEGEEQRKQLTNLFTKVGRIQFLILGLICTGFIFFGMSFIINFWTEPGYEDAYYVMLLLSIPSMIALTQNVGIEIQRAENKHKFRSIAYLIMAVINLILSIFLCQLYGAIGCAIGTAISLLLANGLIINIYYHKKCNINIFDYWKNILRMSPGLIIPCVCGFFINKYVDLSSIYWFAAGIFVYILVYSISVWFISMNDYEKSIVIKPINRLFKRK